MRQLALDVRLADFAQFDTYYPGPNGAAVRSLRAAAMGQGDPVQWLWGPSGAGRSHLLQAASAAGTAAGRVSAWLPLGNPEMQPAMLEGMGRLDLLCVDDIDTVAGDADWEAALFRLFEELRSRSGCLLIAAGAPAADAGFRLRDLASRLASGPTWRLQPLTDEELSEALKLRAGWRGLELPDETADYLLKRVERSAGPLFSLLDELDKAALEEKRRLTVPFVRSVVESPND